MSRLAGAPRSMWKADIKLTKHVTRGQCHLLQIRWIPRTEYDSSVVRGILQLPNDLRQLIHSLTSIVCSRVFVLRSKMSPLESINRSQVSLFSIGEANAV